jgi:hypothetical protein
VSGRIASWCPRPGGCRRGLCIDRVTSLGRLLLGLVEQLRREPWGVGHLRTPAPDAFSCPWSTHRQTVGGLTRSSPAISASVSDGSAPLSVGALFTDIGLWKGIGMAIASAILVLIGILNPRNIDHACHTSPQKLEHASFARILAQRPGRTRMLWDGERGNLMASGPRAAGCLHPRRGRARGREWRLRPGGAP